MPTNVLVVGWIVALLMAALSYRMFRSKDTVVHVAGLLLTCFSGGSIGMLICMTVLRLIGR